MTALIALACAVVGIVGFLAGVGLIVHAHNVNNGAFAIAGAILLFVTVYALKPVLYPPGVGDPP